MRPLRIDYTSISNVSLAPGIDVTAPAAVARAMKQAMGKQLMPGDCHTGKSMAIKCDPATDSEKAKYRELAAQGARVRFTEYGGTDYKMPALGV